MTVSDMGWEAKHICECQLILNWNDQPERHHHWGYSTQNVTIEAYWRQLRHRSAEFWMEKFGNLKNNGYYSKCDLDIMCLTFIYMPILIEDLHTVVDYSDSHHIRSQRRNARPHGRPIHLYESPDTFGFENQGLLVDERQIHQLMNMFGLESLIIPDYLPNEFRNLAESWCLTNNITVILGQNDEQVYIDLRNFFRNLNVDFY